MDSYSPKCLTPEELIIQMTVGEVQELLGALGMDDSADSAFQLKHLVDSTNCLETAIELLEPKCRSRRVA